MTREELRDELVESYVGFARGFYFEGSDEKDVRNEYAPEEADKILFLLDTYIKEMLDDVLGKGGQLEGTTLNQMMIDAQNQLLNQQTQRASKYLSPTKEEK